MLSAGPGRVTSLESTRHETQNQPVPVGVMVALLGVLLPAGIAFSMATTSEMRVVAVVFATLAALLMLAQPMFGLTVFVALLYFRPEETFPALAGLRLAFAVALVTLVGTWAQFFLRKEEPVRSPLPLMIVAFMICAIGSTAVMGRVVSLAANDLLKNTCLVLLILYIIRTPDRYRKLSSTIIAFSAYLALYTIVRYLGGQRMDYEGGGLRALGTGIFGDPNDLAATLVAGMGLTLARMRDPKKSARIFYGLVIGILIAGIFFTNSRGGMLALLAVLGSYFLIFVERKGLAIAGAVAAVLLLLAVGPSRMRSFDSQEAAANERFWYWANGVDQFRVHPLTGVGYGGFPDLNNNMTAHNSFVLCFAELGLPGYFFWMSALYFAFRRPPGADEQDDDEEAETNEKRRALDVQGRSEVLGARLALAGYMVAGFFLSRTYIPVTFMFFTLPMVAQLAYARRTDLFQLSPRDWLKDSGRIMLICLGSIVLIKLLADRLK